MKRQNSVKRSLVASLLVLCLCFAALAGTTFAWFTDSAVTGSNVITAGNLDIDVEYTLDGQEWKELKNAQDLFQKGLWEPGHTEVVALKITNAGDLALKYVANLKVLSETKGKNANGDDIVLSDLLVVSTLVGAEADVATAFDNEDALAYTGTALLKDTSALRDEVEMMKNDVHYLIVKVDMPDSIGNEANYYGETAPKIDLGIEVLATQYTHENDSFGNDYDAGLEISKNGVATTLDDGSEVFYYNEESGFGGRVRLMALPENFGSEYIVPDEVNDLGGALAGVTLDKLTISAGVTDAKKSLQGATIKEVVIEDGATTIPNRMFYQANAESIVIPDSVTYIDENAFAMSGFETLVIPASVAQVGEAAFQHMPNLTTVTFEGDTKIEGYAFRGCPALRTVYLKGDDVTFITSTLNGRDSMWFCNDESNNPNTSDITFHVRNATVAARVYAAMGPEAANTDVYVAAGDGSTNEEAIIFAANTAELQAAINDGAPKIALGEGAYVADLYVVPASRNLTIIGQGADTKIDFKKGQVRLELFDSLTISNCTMGRMVDKSWGQLVFGSSTVAGGVYTISNCIFNGEATQGIYINQNVAATFNIENCTFDGDFGGEGAITIQNNDGVDITVNVTDCSFENIPATSHEIYMLYAYNGWTLNAEGVNAYWKTNP